jgi:hypothetical protein
MITRRRIALEVGELAVLFAETLIHRQLVGRCRRNRRTLIRTHDRFGMLEVGNGRRTEAVDLE